MDPMVFAGTAAQQRLLSAFRTNDPLLDGLITTLVVFFLSACAAYWRALWKRLCAYYDLYLSGSYKVFTLTVARDEKHPFYSYSTLRNIDYDAITWFVTHRPGGFQSNHARIRCFPSSSSGRRNSSGQQQQLLLDDAFTPAANCPIFLESEEVSTEAETKTIRVTYCEDTHEPKDSDREIVYNVRIELSLYCTRGEGLDKLRRFVMHVRDLYFQDISRREWTQQLFRLKRPVPSSSSSEQKKLRWKGHATHSSKTFDKVILDTGLKADLMDDLETFLVSESWYRDMGLSYKRGYMFYGPPGTGKTSAVLAIANRARYDIYSLDLSKIMSDEELDEAFEMLPERCVVMLEDVDCMTDAVKKRRRESQDGGIRDRDQPASSAVISIQAAVEGVKHHQKEESRLTLSALLNNVDGVGSNHGRIFVMTTNHPDVLDPALLRHGRVDMLVALQFCSHEQIGLFFRFYYPGHSEEQLLSCVRKLCGFPPETFSPAEISSTMQHFKKRPEEATERLCQKVAQKC